MRAARHREARLGRSSRSRVARRFRRVRVVAPRPRSQPRRRPALAHRSARRGPRRLTRGVADTAPRLSPDGTRVAFLRGDDKGKAQLHVVAPAGGEPVQVTDAPLGVGAYDWSPDGGSLAFIARVPEQGRYGRVEGLDASAEAPRHITGMRWHSNGLGYHRRSSRAGVHRRRARRRCRAVLRARAGGAPDGEQAPEEEASSRRSDATHRRATPHSGVVLPPTGGRSSRVATRSRHRGATCARVWSPCVRRVGGARDRRPRGEPVGDERRRRSRRHDRPAGGATSGRRASTSCARASRSGCASDGRPAPTHRRRDHRSGRGGQSHHADRRRLPRAGPDAGPCAAAAGLARRRGRRRFWRRCGGRRSRGRGRPRGRVRRTPDGVRRARGRR